MYVPVFGEHVQINYLENKNGHGWVQLGRTVCNWRRGFMVG